MARHTVCLLYAAFYEAEGGMNSVITSAIFKVGLIIIYAAHDWLYIIRIHASLNFLSWKV